MLQSARPDLQAGILDAWNGSSVAPDAAYAVDFVRNKLRSRNILGRSWHRRPRVTTTRGAVARAVALGVFKARSTA